MCLCVHVHACARVCVCVLVMITFESMNFHQIQSIVNLTSQLLTEEVVDTWISAGNISANVQALLMAVETVAEALVDVANQTESGIVTILTENIREEQWKRLLCSPMYVVCLPLLTLDGSIPCDCTGVCSTYMHS